MVLLALGRAQEPWVPSRPRFIPYLFADPAAFGGCTVEFLPVGCIPKPCELEEIIFMVLPGERSNTHGALELACSLVLLAKMLARTSPANRFFSWQLLPVGKLLLHLFQDLPLDILLSHGKLPYISSGLSSSKTPPEYTSFPCITT
jgi:hypothetical protein